MYINSKYHLSESALNKHTPTTENPPAGDIKTALKADYWLFGFRGSVFSSLCSAASGPPERG